MALTLAEAQENIDDSKLAEVVAHWLSTNFITKRSRVQILPGAGLLSLFLLFLSSEGVLNLGPPLRCNTILIRYSTSS